MNNKKTPSTVIINLPKDKAKMVHGRIQSFLDLYNEEQRIQSRFFDLNPKNNFDILSLCYSCYLQGLTDAEEVLKNKR